MLSRLNAVRGQPEEVVKRYKSLADIERGFQPARRNCLQKILQLTPREPGAFGIPILGGAPDHPMTINFPEGEYIKGLVLMRK